MPCLRCIRIGPDEARRFDAYMEKERGASILQSYAWGDFKAQYGWRPYRLLVEDGGEVVAGVALLENRDSEGRTFVYSPRGPVLDWDRDRMLLLFLRDHLQWWAQEQSWAYWVLDPEWEHSLELENWLHQEGFVLRDEGPFGGIQPRWVWRIPLSVREEEQWKALRKGARRQIRKARRHTMRIAFGHEEFLDDLVRVLRCTEAHQGIRLRDRSYFQGMLAALRPPGYVTVAMAYWDHQPVAGALLTHYASTTWDLYAGCDRRLDIGASYMLLYACLRYAARHAQNVYDLGGIVPSDQGGLTLFKSRFGGHPVQWMGEYRWEFTKGE